MLTCHSAYQTALDEFERLDDYTDVYDKLNCLVLTRHFLVDHVMSHWQSRKQFNPDELIMYAAAYC